MSPSRPNARHGARRKTKHSVSLDPELVARIAPRFGGLSQAIDKALRVAEALLTLNEDEELVEIYNLKRADAGDCILDGAVFELLDASAINRPALRRPGRADQAP